MTESNSNTPTSRHSNIREDFERSRSPRPSSPTVQLLVQKRREKQQQQQQQQHQTDDDQLIKKEKYQSLFDDDDDDFMLNIVHGSCQRLFDHTERIGSSHSNMSRNDVITTDSNDHHRNICHGELINGCQMTFEDHLDLFTHCRQPLSFLSFFHEHDSNDDMGVEVLPAGAYIMQRYCEYCGSDDTRHCLDTCKRPKLFFQKKRSPFEKPNRIKWDPITDHYIPPPPSHESNEQNNTNDNRSDTTRPLSPSILPKSGSNWVANLFQPSSPSNTN